MLGEQRVALAARAPPAPPAPARACPDPSAAPRSRRSASTTSWYSRERVDQRLRSRTSAFECARNFAVSAWTAGSAISAISCSYVASTAVKFVEHIDPVYRVTRSSAAGHPPDTGGRNATSSPSLQRRRHPRVLLVDGARHARGRRPPAPDARAPAVPRRPARVAPSGHLEPQLGRAGDLPQPREQPNGYEHARSIAACRAASSSGSAVAPSIQTSPPSKCSCFQIGAICLMRSIA